MPSTASATAGQRLFRQPERGDWASVVAEIGAALRQAASAGAAAPRAERATSA